MIKVTVISLCALILVILLKQSSKEFAFIVTIAATVILFGLVIDDLTSILDKINTLSNQIENLNSYVSLMVKILAVTLITQFIIDLCKDNGESALASQTEITSKILILIMVMPLFESVINIVSGLLK